MRPLADQLAPLAEDRTGARTILAEQRRKAEQLGAAADEQRESACQLGDSDAILDATAARYRALSLLAATNRDPWPPRPYSPGLLDRLDDDDSLRPTGGRSNLRKPTQHSPDPIRKMIPNASLVFRKAAHR
jgi:hypothetical protein